jgi:ParB-like chromosome segregation protein Spo0J
MTCAELTAVGLPAAYVPLPHGNGEQRLNAEPIEEAGGGLIVDDADLSPDWIGATLLPILLDGELVAAMGRAAAASGNRAADTELAAQVLRLGREQRPRRPHRSAARSVGARRAAGQAPPARSGRQPSPPRPAGQPRPTGPGGPAGRVGR